MHAPQARDSRLQPRELLFDLRDDLPLFVERRKNQRNAFSECARRNARLVNVLDAAVFEVTAHPNEVQLMCNESTVDILWRS